MIEQQSLRHTYCMIKFFFNMGLLSAPGGTTAPSSSSSSTSASSQIKKRCTKCSKEIPHSEMRLHVAKHILDGGLYGPKTCGFCGQQTCLQEIAPRSQIIFKKILWGFYPTYPPTPLVLHLPVAILGAGTGDTGNDVLLVAEKGTKSTNIRQQQDNILNR